MVGKEGGSSFWRGGPKRRRIASEGSLASDGHAQGNFIRPPGTGMLPGLMVSGVMKLVRIGGGDGVGGSGGVDGDG